MPTFRILAAGRVQGVGFRAYAADCARRLGLDGEVWNREDGKVEILVSVPSEQHLADFLEALGSAPGIVRELENTATELDLAPGFRIVAGRR